MLTYDLKEGTGPLYLRLYEQIREDIRSGAVGPGSRLPSKRTLAEHLGVSVITVDGAYRCLIDEGYVISRERSGYFAARLGQAAPRETEAAGDIPEEETEAGTDHGFRYSALWKIMREVISERGEKLLAKPPAFGCAELRRAIAAFLRRYRGMRVEPGRVIVGSGAEYLYGMLAQLLGRERTFAVEEPGYVKIRKVYESMGVTCRFLPLDGDGVSSEALEATDADILHVTPYHSFPTGITASHEKRREYLDWAARGERYVVEDDFDSEFSPSRRPQEPLFSMDRGGKVIYLNTFSHSLAPSMRIGYMVLPDELFRLYEERLGFYSCPVPVFDQYVLARFIDRGHFERHLNRVRRQLRAEGE